MRDSFREKATDMKPKRIWVIGAGRFGQRAAEKLKKRYPAADIIPVDSNEKVCRRMRVDFPATVCSGGIAYLAGQLDAAGGPDWIIPSMPVHVAFGWIKKRLAPHHDLSMLPVSDDLLALLPNAARGKQGAIYTSHAEFICPENCPEPATTCIHTGMPRPADLFQVLEAIAYRNYRPVVIRSRQLLPGVGGYRPAALFGALATVENSARPVMLSTACRCHGVMHVFAVKRRPEVNARAPASGS